MANPDSSPAQAKPIVIAVGGELQNIGRSSHWTAHTTPRDLIRPLLLQFAISILLSSRYLSLVRMSERRLDFQS
jgi:hypothetical protein